MPPTKIAPLFKFPAAVTTELGLPSSVELSAGAKSVARANTGWLTGGEVREALTAYCEREALLCGGCVTLDPVLTKLFFSQTKKEKAREGEYRAPESVMMPELVEAATEKHLVAGYAVCAGSTILSMSAGAPARVNIYVERRNQSYIMRLRGVEGYGIDAAVYAKEFSNRWERTSAASARAKRVLRGHTRL